MRAGPIIAAQALRARTGVGRCTPCGICALRPTLRDVQSSRMTDSSWALPDAVAAEGQARFDQWRATQGPEVALPAQVAVNAPAVFGCSAFVADTCTRDPPLLAHWTAAGELDRPRGPGEIDELFLRHTAGAADEAVFMAALRRLRRAELARIAWRDLCGALLAETLADLSACADAAVRVAREFAVQLLEPRYGRPRSAAGEEQELIVLGMGKLGGGELNFSSDIDLVFLYPEAGETDGRRPVDNAEYFLRLGQAVIRLLDAPTADGFVYRVDMRLRPFGDSGPLVASFGAFEDYLQQHGRDWERYAWVKARAITGAERYRVLYADVVRPFVFRRYLDFGVFESLREMKGLIEREVVRRDLQGNVKLGPGGIREIEFILQAFQLIRGGSNRRLQTQSLLTALPLLAGSRLLPEEAVRELIESYTFLRRVENRLQLYADAQTHSLPVDDAGRERLAAAMRFPGWDAFAAALDAERERVAGHFRAQVFGPENREAHSTAGPDLVALWADVVDLPRLTAALVEARIADSAGCAEDLAELRQSSLFRRLGEFGRRRLAQVLPRLLDALAHDGGGAAGEAAAPGATRLVLRRLLRVVEAIATRSAYLALLNEHPTARRRLVELCRYGDFLAGQLAAFPLLLDELIDERLFDAAPDRVQFRRELDARCDHAQDDPERQAEALRQFQRAAVFRVAVLDLTGRLPLMQVSDRLTEIAELILERAMRFAWQHTVAVHGVPRCGPDEASLRDAAVAAIGYGKMGGIELGYGSDLDLVFVHDSQGAVQRTAGPKVVENGVFFLRWGQRVVHLLTVHTAAGRLYEVDMRLRPSGKGGLAVTWIGAFEEYQKQEAWTWEHQALLHSRAVAGDAALCAEFARVRREVLTGHVRRDGLRDEVRQMRERMRHELARSKDDEFDMKQDTGGIADIEFLTQYWTLAHAAGHPPLLEFSDTIRQLESLGSAALVDHRAVDRLRDTYRRYRQEIHHRSLEDRKAVVPAGPWAECRAFVTAVWDRVMVAGEELRQL